MLASGQHERGGKTRVERGEYWIQILVMEGELESDSITTYLLGNINC